jgi:aspartyl-tRNA(Asn)/glutamyl-tRNA(Gln) amidotransferase subunit C
MATKFTPSDVSHIASLANIPISEEEKASLAEGFTKTIAVVEKLNVLDVSSSPSSQITGLSNVMRDDVVDVERMFSQEEALANAPHHKDGFFIVDQIIEQED